MPKNSNISELKTSLDEILIDLQLKKITSRGMYSAVSVNEAIKALENIQLMPIESLECDDMQCDDVQFVKKLLIIERIFINSSKLNAYPLPNFAEIINPAALIYAEIDLQLDVLENRAKILLVQRHILESSKASNMVFLLRKLNRVYFIKGKIDYATYKEKSLAIINKERPELDKHRGYKQIFRNLLTLIAGLRTKPLLNEVRTENFLFFKQPDDSIKQIEGTDEPLSNGSLKKNNQADISFQDYRQDSKVQYTTL